MDGSAQVLTWGALGIGVVAVTLLIVVAVASHAATDEPAAASTSSGVTVAPIDQPDAGLDEVDPPLTGLVTIDAPFSDGIRRYRVDDETVIVDLTVDDCGREDGVMGARGTLGNLSHSGQTLDFAVGIDLIHALTGTPLGHLETRIDALAPGESTVWSVETTSTRVVRLRCIVTALTVAPVGSM